MIWSKEIKKRILGIYGDILSNNLLIVLAGVHGNETAGIQAIQNVMAYLREHQIPCDGCIVGLQGNMTALREGVRYIDTDLNRLWSTEQIDKIRKGHIDGYESIEHREQRELLTIIDQLLIHREASDPFIFLDLHTTSAESGHFLIINQNDRSGYLTDQLSVPVIEGLTEVLRHTTLDMFSRQSMMALAYEAGQHDDAAAIKRMEALILSVMHAQHMIVLTDHTLCEIKTLLSQEAQKLPKKFGFAYRHQIAKEDEFTMKSGHNNFEVIRKDQVLGTDIRGEVKAPIDGYLLMPLYQKMGSDGFFIIVPN